MTWPMPLHNHIPGTNKGLNGCPHHIRLPPEQRRARLYCILTKDHGGLCVVPYLDTTPPSSLTWDPNWHPPAGAET